MDEDKVQLMAYSLIKKKAVNMEMAISDTELAWYVRGIVDLQREINRGNKRLAYADSQASQLILQSAT